MLTDRRGLFRNQAQHLPEIIFMKESQATLVRPLRQFTLQAGHARSAGLCLVMTLARQLNGTFEVEHGPGPAAVCGSLIHAC